MGFNFTGEPRTGIQHRIVALRSLFRALRQERIIFRDPTRGISLPATARLPQPLPADRVAGLLDRADGPAARLAVALVAIHAVTEADLVRLQAADLDLATGTLTVQRGLHRRVIYLVDGETIIVRSHLGAAIVAPAGTGDGTVVCYEADDLDPVRHTGWSVIATGMARLVREPAAIALYEQTLEPVGRGPDGLCHLHRTADDHRDPAGRLVPVSLRLRVTVLQLPYGEGSLLRQDGAQDPGQVSEVPRPCPVCSGAAAGASGFAASGGSLFRWLVANIMNC